MNLISECGFYRSSCGEIVEITRILTEQQFAEGYVHFNGQRSIWSVWHINGQFNRNKPSDHDLVTFLWPLNKDESYDD